MDFKQKKRNSYILLPLVKHALLSATLYYTKETLKQHLLQKLLHRDTQ